MSTQDRHIVDKIDDLTTSLHRTTDVLSTADRMIDHYRDLNREQEHEIARLQDDLHRVSQEKRSRYESKLTPTDASHQRTRKSHNHDTSSEFSSDDQRKKSSQRRKMFTSTPSRVRFKRNSNSSDNEKDNFENSIISISRRQDIIEKEMQKERQYRNDELDRLDLTVRKHLSTNHEEHIQSYANSQLQRIQEQLDEERRDWKMQQKEIKFIADGMESLKDVVMEVKVPNKSKRVDSRNTPDSIEEELRSYKRKCIKGDEIINSLNETIRKKENESNVFKTTIDEFQSLGKMKSDQLKLLEDQLQNERNEKQTVLAELDEIHKKVAIVEKANENYQLKQSAIKAEARADQFAYERLSQQIPELKHLLEKSERQRDKYSDHVHRIDSELALKENTIEKLSKQLSDYKTKIKLMEREAEKQVEQQEERIITSADAKQEVDHMKAALSEAENTIKKLEKSRMELKEKALHALKEYRSKCRQCEKQLDNAMEVQKTNELELSKEIAAAKELEIKHLKLLKKYEENLLGIEKLKQDLVDCEDRLVEVHHEKSQLQLTLSNINDETKQVVMLKREIQALRDEQSILNSHLIEEKRKKKEFESLLHDNYEKSLSKSKESSSLHKQLEEERNDRVQIIDEIKQESENAAKKELDSLKDKITKLENDKVNLECNLQLCVESKQSLESKFNQQVNDTERQHDRNNEIREKIRRLSEENKKLRRHVQLSKLDFKERMEAMDSQLKIEKDQKRVCQERIQVCQRETSQAKDVVKVLMSISNRDAENILNLLSHEEENILPVKDIPDNLVPEYKKLLLQLREKLETSYSIIKTLKKRFQQQKILIQKARDKLKAQQDEIDSINKSRVEESEKLSDKITELRNAQILGKESLIEKDKKIFLLKGRVDELTKHLEECTRVFHQNMEAEKERENVIQEMDKLKNEHMEYRILDETFYRGSEKVEVLTEQLNEAKNSLTQMRRDALDKSDFANRVIDSFGSVSPSRKRKLFSFNSPCFKSTTRTLFGLDSSYLEESRDASGNQTVEPMSMTDKEFNDIFVQNKSLRRSAKKSKFRDSPVIPKHAEKSKTVTYEHDQEI